jgi:hypothetical protein
MSQLIESGKNSMRAILTLHDRNRNYVFKKKGKISSKLYISMVTTIKNCLETLLLLSFTLNVVHFKIFVKKM